MGNHNCAQQMRLVFSHPDCTVGIGIAPIHTHKGSRTIPPVRNFTYPQRLIYFVYELIVTLLLGLCNNKSLLLRKDIKYITWNKITIIIFLFLLD